MEVVNVSSKDLEQQVDELEQRVQFLESLVASGGAVDGHDKYDQHVLSKLREADESVPTRIVLRWYRESGVKNRDKMRTRLQDLKAADLIEPVGKAAWRYTGPEQSTLEATA